MDRVKVSKEQAEALEKYTSNSIDDKQHLIRHYMGYSEAWNDAYVPLRDMGFDNFVIALYVGYEVELTKEEQLAKYFKSLREEHSKEHFERKVVS